MADQLQNRLAGKRLRIEIMARAVTLCNDVREFHGVSANRLVFDVVEKKRFLPGFDGMECKQPFGCRWGKTPKGGENGIPRLFTAISAFGKKLVGIANQFFERCLRLKILRRKR